MYINLNHEEEQAVMVIAANMAENKGITHEQAIKDLLGMGLSSWREMQEMRSREAERKARNFNPFAAARGEYK